MGVITNNKTVAVIMVDSECPEVLNSGSNRERCVSLTLRMTHSETHSETRDGRDDGLADGEQATKQPTTERKLKKGTVQAYELLSGCV